MEKKNDKNSCPHIWGQNNANSRRGGRVLLYGKVETLLLLRLLTGEAFISVPIQHRFQEELKVLATRRTVPNPAGIM